MYQGKESVTVFTPAVARVVRDARDSGAS